jgi:hypothetical protein
VACDEDLYLFTTLTEPAEEVVALDGERWNIETDLLSLREEVRLREVSENGRLRTAACPGQL